MMFNLTLVIKLFNIIIMKLTFEIKSEIYGKIISLFNANPKITVKKVGEACGISRQTASKYIAELKGANRLKKLYQRTYDDTMFADTFEHEYTWLAGFMRNVRRYSGSAAVIDPETGRRWSYKSLNSEANRLARALQRKGLGKNDVVMSALRNCPAFAFGYVGPRKIGSILLAANASLSSGEMALLMDHNQPKAVIYSANIIDTITGAEKLTKCRDVVYILADNIEGREVPAGHILYEDFVRDEPDSEPEIDFRPHIYDEVLRLCTSGTTALPKSVPINDINEVLSAHDVIMQYPLNRFDVTLNMTPWFHRGGCHCAGPGPVFYVGGACVVMRNFKPSVTLGWVQEYKITFLMGAPTNLEMLCRAQERERRDISNLHGIVTMGAPLSRADCIKFSNTLTPNIYNGYGTTETFWNAFLRPYDLPDGAGSVGGSCLDDEVRVVSIYEGKKAEPDDTVPHDKIAEGEVIIKSPAKSSYSYYKNDEMNKARYYKGWYYTGDTGTWDENWIITIRGRKDDMMVVSGENIYPSQIEDAINRNPKVRDCIVTAVPDKVRGQSVAAYVIPEDESLTIDELASFCAQSPLLSKYKRPRYYALVKEIPRTATGKKQHFQIKERAAKDLETGFLRRG